MRREDTRRVEEKEEEKEKERRGRAGPLSLTSGILGRERETREGCWCGQKRERQGGGRGVSLSFSSRNLSPSSFPISSFSLILSHTQRFPAAADITAFRIPSGVFIKLHPATWHAGPLFEAAACLPAPLERAEGGTGHQERFMNFANLEMADTNVTDHSTHVYGDGGGFLVVPPPAK